MKDGKNGGQSCKGIWSCPASGCEGKDLGCSEGMNVLWVKSGRAAGRRCQARNTGLSSSHLGLFLLHCSFGGIRGRRRGVSRVCQPQQDFFLY